MKLFLICLYSLICTSLVAQDWSNIKTLDTFRYENGRIQEISNWTNGDAIYFTYHLNGNFSKKQFSTRKNGIQYEEVTEYFENGNTEKRYFYYVIDRKVYGKPKLDSTYKEYYKNGAIKEERFYVNNKENGITTTYFPNGQIESKMTFVNDKLMAIESFDDNGNSLPIGNFKDGNGKLIIYKSGFQVSICRYKNGRELTRTCKCD